MVAGIFGLSLITLVALLMQAHRLSLILLGLNLLLVIALLWHLMTDSVPINW